MARIALGVTGSVAAIRAPALAAALCAEGHDTRVVATTPSLYFFDPLKLPAPVEDAGPPLGTKAIFQEQDEWPGMAGEAPPSAAYRRRDPVLHIELRRWADLLLIAPLDANTLAKLAYGFSDNLLTCLYRAWDRSRPIVLAPAMNTFMWENPLTERHLRLLLETHGDGSAPPPPGASLEVLIDAINRSCRRLHICSPQIKRLACGDEGVGAMAEVLTITLAAAQALEDRPPTCA